jgi:hypothetical protein
MIRQTAASLVVLNAVLFMFGIVWFPVLLVVQWLVSVVALVVLYFCIAQLCIDVE